MSTTTGTRVKVPLTPQQHALLDAVHDASTYEAREAQRLLGTVPASDSGALSALLTHVLTEIEVSARRARLDAAYDDAAAETEADTEGRAVDARLATAALSYTLDDE